MVPSTWVLGKGEVKELWPTLNSKDTRQQGDPAPSDTVGVLEVTQVPRLAHGCTWDLQILHINAPFNPHVHDPQLS